MDAVRLMKVITLSQLPGEAKPAGFVRTALRRFIVFLLAWLVVLVFRAVRDPKAWRDSQIRSYSGATAGASSRPAADQNPRTPENGDRRGRDNDGDGRLETRYVEGYRRADGTTVKGHYRAAPGGSTTPADRQ